MTELNNFRSAGGAGGELVDCDGRAVDGEFRVTSYTNSSQLYSKVQGLADGG